MSDPQRAYGKFRGTVTDVEDPEQRGRLKATVPEVLHDVPTGWAEPCAPYGGDGEGLWAIPPVGAGVWMEFEAGDPSRPVWTGCWWPSGQVPDDAAGSPATPKVKVLRTTEGLHAALDDEGKTITVSDDGGSNLLEIKSQDGQVTIKAGTKVLVAASQIELTDGASHALVFGDSLMTYLNSVVTAFQSHMHPGQQAGPFPVTPAPPAAPLPSPTSSMLSTKVKTG